MELWNKHIDIIFTDVVHTAATWMPVHILKGNMQKPGLCAAVRQETFPVISSLMLQKGARAGSHKYSKGIFKQKSEIEKLGSSST